MKLDNNFTPKLTRNEFGRHSRNLPHLDADEIAQFVTFRLFDSMPQELLDKWRAESTNDSHFRKKIEAYLDAGAGECHLRRPEIAEIVQNALKFHDGKKYRLCAWVLMPNHGHVLPTQFTGFTFRRSCIPSNPTRPRC